MSAAIGTVSTLVSAIRSRLDSAAPAAARRAAVRPNSGRRHGDRNLTALIETRVHQIAKEDPQRGRKAFRVFLEAVLLSHLGEELMTDPRFYQILDDVQGALETNAATAILVQQAIDHLLSQPSPDVPARR